MSWEFFGDSLVSSVSEGNDFRRADDDGPGCLKNETMDFWLFTLFCSSSIFEKITFFFN